MIVRLLSASLAAVAALVLGVAGAAVPSDAADHHAPVVVADPERCC